jgi:hypothetical protein
MYLQILLPYSFIVFIKRAVINAQVLAGISIALCLYNIFVINDCNNMRLQYTKLTTLSLAVRQKNEMRMFGHKKQKLQEDRKHYTFRYFIFFVFIVIVTVTK